MALARSNAERIGETIEQRVERLSTQEQKRRTDNRRKLAEGAAEDCTFHPQINPVSRAMATTETVDHEGRSVSASEQGGRVHDRLYQEAQDRVEHNTATLQEQEEKFKQQ